MPEELDHLNFKEWPFRVVPTRRSSETWVGRPQALRRIQRIARRASKSGVAEIILIWASFGSGKTHALRHLEHLASQDPNLHSVYVATPKGVRSFRDVYSSIIDAVIESGALAAAGRDLWDRNLASGKPAPGSDLEKALIRVGMYPEDPIVVHAWLRGDKVPLRELRDIGISSRIETTPDAIRALNGLIDIIQRDGKVTMVLLLDEMQEFGELTPRQLDECIGGFQKVFNQNEQGFVLVMSFTSGTQDTIRGVIGEALYDRSGEKVSLPPLTHEETLAFLEGLIADYSLDSSKTPWPFTTQSLAEIVSHVESLSGAITPRRAIKAADLVLKDASMDIEDGFIDEISADYVKKLLDESAEQLSD